MKKQTSAASVALLLALGLTASSPLAQTAAKQSGRGIDLSYMETPVKPCQDFYQYANGHWLTNNPIPAETKRKPKAMERSHWRQSSRGSRR